MKNTIKVLGIIVLIAVLAFTMITCNRGGSSEAAGSSAASSSGSTSNSNVPSDLIGKWGVYGMAMFEFTSSGIQFGRMMGGDPDLTLEIRKTGDAIEVKDPAGSGWEVLFNSYTVTGNTLRFADDDGDVMEFDRVN